MVIYVPTILPEDIDVCQYLSMNEPLCCAPLLTEPLSLESAQQLAADLKALADPARLRLLSIIAAHPGQEACVCELVEPLGLTQPTVTHHLQVLEKAGLVEREQRGVWAYYRLVPARLRLISQTLQS
jgi:ArsR family transcriptional regulator, arsenate/arsenite/antimonite-responsive transcriptional repressor